MATYSVSNGNAYDSNSPILNYWIIKNKNK